MFTLHHLRPAKDCDFQPNCHLEVTPEFLSAMLAHPRSREIELVSMDEVHQRLLNRNFARHFACLPSTRAIATSVTRRRADARICRPFTCYVVSDFAEGIGRRIALERSIAGAAALEQTILRPDAPRHSTATAQRLSSSPPSKRGGGARGDNC